jgi:membrane-associated protease RseP (regulator of RpoE activity)
MTILVLFVALLAASLAHLLGRLTAALAVRAPLEIFGLFLGPKLFDLQLGRATLRVNLIPVGGYLKFRDDGNPGGLSELSRGARLLILLAGSTAMLLLACILLGPSQFLEAVQRNLASLQTFWASSPSTPRTASVGGQAMSISRLVGLVSVGLAMLDLLPIPPLSGGQASIVLFLGRRCTPAAMGRANKIGIGILVGLFVLVTLKDVRSLLAP